MKVAFYNRVTGERLFDLPITDEQTSKLVIVQEETQEENTGGEAELTEVCIVLLEDD